MSSSAAGEVVVIGMVLDLPQEAALQVRISHPDWVEIAHHLEGGIHLLGRALLVGETGHFFTGGAEETIVVDVADDELAQLFGAFVDVEHHQLPFEMGDQAARPGGDPFEGLVVAAFDSPPSPPLLPIE